MLTHSLSWNSPSVTRLTFHTKQQFRSSIWKGSEKGAGMIKICSSSYKRDNCTCQDSSLWEGDDLGIPLTGRKGVKGTDRSLFFPKHELGSLAMVLGTRVKRRYFISWWLCTGGMLCQSPAQTEKLMWIPMRDCKYFRDTKTQTTAGSENTLSWEQADTWRVSGHHIHFLYSFPSVVMSDHEILFRQTLVINTHGYFDGNFHIPCHFQLLLPAVAACFQQQESGMYEIPSFALEDLLWVQQKQGQLVCLRPRGKALHPSKQTKRVSILTAS